jgi:hypothetical protein
LDAVDELKLSIGRLIYCTAGKNAPWPPPVQVKDMREPAIDRERMAADMD